MDLTTILTILGLLTTIGGGVIGWYVQMTNAQLKSMKKDIEIIKDKTARQEASIKVLEVQRSDLKEDLTRIEKKVDKVLDKMLQNQ